MRIEAISWSRWASIARPSLLAWAGIALCVVGLLVEGTWRTVPVRPLRELLLLALIVTALAWPLRRLLRWRWADALAVVWLGALLLFAGPLPVLAVLLLVAGALAAGSLVLPGPGALVPGLAMIAGVLGWMLPLPIHHRWVYLCLFAGLVAWRRIQVRDALACAWQGWRAAAATTPRAAVGATLLLGLATTACWQPTMQYDDLVYHLGLPFQLLTHGRYMLDPSHQVWALAPWAGDVLQAIPQVLSGLESRGALNAVWLVATAVGVFQVTGQLGGSAWQRWAAVALYASLPLTTVLAGGMQTETPASAALLALAWLVLRDPPQPGRAVLAGALILGLLAGLKTMHVLVALPLLALAAWRHRGRWPWSRLPLAAVAAVAVGASSFTYAWAVSGNPLLPLFNAVFRSPYFPARNFDDPRWHVGLDGDVLWDMTFDTDRYLEAWDGGIGMLLVAGAGLWLLALLRPRSRAYTLAVTGCALLTLLPLQYARYLHPACVLLVPALAAALGALPRRSAAVLVTILCVLNLGFVANGHWLGYTGVLRYTTGALGADRPVLLRYAPERLLAAEIRARAPDSGPVLVLGEIAPLAELGTRARSVAWYAPRMQAAAVAADADRSGRAWAALLREHRIAEVIVNPDTLKPSQSAGLKMMKAAPAATAGPLEWWRLPSGAGP